MYLQLSGDLDVIQILNSETPTAAIFAMFNMLPMKYFVISLYTLLALIFTATTFDSISYILASVVQRKLGDEPMRWNRLFWAGAMSIMPITLLLLGGLATLQTATIVASVPLLIVALLLCISMVKIANFDLRYQPDYERHEIQIEEFPREDPWTDEGSWDLEDHDQNRERPD